MKKFMFAAMAALAITGCSQSEEFDAPSQKVAIGFNTVVSKTTRAAITDITALQTSGFKAYAYTSADPIDKTFPATVGTLMNPADVTYSANNWVSGEYYWPLTDKVHFYAYATDAAAAFVVPAESAYPSLTYTIDTDATKQKDFVVAKLENQVKGDNAIQLAFTHALTQVNFTAVGDNADFTYTISSIKIVDVANTGTYSFAGSGAWTAGADLTASYEYPIDEAKKKVTGTTENVLDVTGNTLMLMPQEMNDDARILVSYTVSNSAGVIYKATETPISLKGKTAWGAGKKIRYSLTLTQEGLVSMKFAPNVDNWGDPEVNG